MDFMDPPVWVTDARYVGGYRVWLRFNDGLDGEIDLSSELHGEVFEPLRDVELFSQLRLHPEYETIVWPNGADLAPEFLYEQVKRAVSDAA
jgi:hypothetical protein